MITDTPAEEQQSAECEAEGGEHTRRSSLLSRRSALKLLGVATIPVATQSASATTTDGYGGAEYGADFYGGSSE